MDIKKILIVGNGSIGRRHQSIARKFFPSADIRVLSQSRLSNQTSDVNGLFHELEEAVHFGSQIAVIANPSNMHIEIAKILAKEGTHLLIEKPISNEIQGVEELLKICKNNKVTLLIGYNLRFLNSLNCFKRAIDQNIIGSVLSIRCEVGQYLPLWRTVKNYQDSVSAQRKLGGGVLLELSHEIDYLSWIFGEIEWVYSVISKYSNLEIDVEDCAYILMGFKKFFSQDQLIGNVTMDFIRHDTTRYCTAIGEAGTLRWDAINSKVALLESGETSWIDLFNAGEENNSYEAEWRHFLEIVEINGAPIVSGFDALSTLKIIEAIKISSKKKKRIFID